MEQAPASSVTHICRGIDFHVSGDVDPADHLAARVAVGGDPRPVHIEETETSFAVGWQGHCHITGAAFVFTDGRSGRVITTLGYPTQGIVDRITELFG